MTDNDIIKALECCLAKDLVNDRCEECPNFLMGAYCMDRMLKDALDLINRQKAEIDEHKSEIAILKDSNKNLQELYYTEKEKVKKAKQKVIDIAKSLQTARAEAIKEFAERLTKNIFPVGYLCDGNYSVNAKAVKTVIDNLVKEMTEEQNDV